MLYCYKAPAPVPWQRHQRKSGTGTSLVFTTKIKYDGIIFAKNERFAPMFAEINIKSHYLQDLKFKLIYCRLIYAFLKILTEIQSKIQS